MMREEGLGAAFGSHLDSAKLTSDFNTQHSPLNTQHSPLVTRQSVFLNDEWRWVGVWFCGLKGLSIKAWGNALGLGFRKIFSPEGAA